MPKLDEAIKTQDGPSETPNELPEQSLAIDYDTSDDEIEIALPAYEADLSDDRVEIRKQVIDLALPALAEMMLMTLVNMADMIMVGRLGPWAITAVGLSNQPLFVAMSVFMSLNVGATALVARSIGAKDPDDAFKVARQALVIATGLGALLSLIGVVFAPQILSFMGAEADALGPGIAYFRIVAAGVIFQGAAMSLGASLRGAGDTKTPMSANMVANLVNLVGNYLLIYGHFGFPRLDVVGAAIPTTLSRFVALVLILHKVFGHQGAVKMSLTDSFRLDKETLGRILKIGLPAAGEQLVMRSGQMLFARIVSSFGTVVFAAHQVAINAESLSFNPPMAFQTAATALCGQSLGAKKPERAMTVGREARTLGFCMSAVTGAILFFLGRYIVFMYTDDPIVMDLSSSMLKIIAIAQPFMAMNFVLAGALRGAGDTKWTLYITMAGIWGVRLAFAYILALKLNMGLTGAWIAMALDMVTRALLVNARFRTGHWTKLRV